MRLKLLQVKTQTYFRAARIALPQSKTYALEANPDIDAQFDAGDGSPFYGFDQTALAEVRQREWPDVSSEVRQETFAENYLRVKAWGIPNEKGSKIIISTRLNIGLWEENMTGHTDDLLVMQGIKHGFSMQYLGPPLKELECEMHDSGKNYQSHIQDYFDVEREYGAIVGPFKTPPFTPWCRTSPIMSRPKSDSDRRRIIIDLSYPPDSNVNKWVIKGNYYGKQAFHKLPRIDDIVHYIVSQGFQLALATIDSKRAYRNFPGCPLDYPLNVVKFRGGYYLDLAMPFGARTSSLYMQKIADLIARALQKRGIPTHIYLDDVILYFRPDQNPQARMREALDFMRALGLPLAEGKCQDPQNRVKYLGIWFDLIDKSISMPQEKITKFLEIIKWVTTQDSVSKKIVQTVIGKAIHVVACVPAARTFINRILMALRQSHLAEFVHVDHGFRQDLRWFEKFLNKFNGRSMMKACNPQFVIEADACLQGGGATDYMSYIAYAFPKKCETFHISILEALNCLAAVRAFMTKEKHSSVVLIKCDNQATIECFNRGTARDPYMAAISRAMWYVLARADATPIYQYTPGDQMTTADALSRMLISPQHRAIADDIISTCNLERREIKPYYLDFSGFM